MPKDGEGGEGEEKGHPDEGQTSQSSGMPITTSAWMLTAPKDSQLSLELRPLRIVVRICWPWAILPGSARYGVSSAVRCFLLAMTATRRRLHGANSKTAAAQCAWPAAKHVEMLPQSHPFHSDTLTGSTWRWTTPALLGTRQPNRSRCLLHSATIGSAPFVFSSPNAEISSF